MTRLKVSFILENFFSVLECEVPESLQGSSYTAASRHHGVKIEGTSEIPRISHKYGTGGLKTGPKF